MTHTSHSNRLEGLDFARFLAFVGMAIVNFKIVMGAIEGDDWLSVLVGSLEGKAAASFVVLAGIGLGLSSLRGTQTQTVWVTFKRAVFLLVIGLINMLIFDADILHYYAFYFFFGALLLSWNLRALALAIVGINGVAILMMLLLDYDTGWYWPNFTYLDFWTMEGFIRNLFFNGWHPVFPWLSFLVFGMLLCRLDLGTRRTQRWMLAFGVTTVVLAELVSHWLQPIAKTIDPELIFLVTTEPIPPMPLYMLAGMGTASSVIALSLLGSAWLSRIGVLAIVTPAGRQSLTLYIAHIILGMGTLEVLGLLGGQSIETAVLTGLIFCGLAVLYAWVWSRFFKRGPIETAMRKLAG